MKKVKTLKIENVKGRVPVAAQYGALKGMCYSPSVRDNNRKARKGAKQSIRRGDWS